MSQTLETDRTVKPQRHLTAEEQAAIVAAVTTGRPQVQVAKDFGVHRNTVNALCRRVKAVDTPAHPLANGYKPVLERESVNALLRGLQHTANPYDAAKIGVECMKGMGIFSTGSHIQVDTHNEINITWGAVQEPEHASNVIDVSPLESHKET